MKLALLSDVHANHVALARAIAHCEGAGVDGFVLMGDYVCDFPNPEMTFALIAKLREKHPTWLIRGNRDEYLLDYRAGKLPLWRDGSASGSLLYTYERLRPRDFALLASLPACMEVRIDGHEPFTVCHASPFFSREIIIDDVERISQCLDAVSTDQLFLDHTHRVKLFRAGKKAAHFVGSVGLPDGLGGLCQFALIDDGTGTWQIEHVMAEYDVEEAMAEFLTSGLSTRAGMWALAVQAMARTGKNMPELLNRTAREMSCGEGGIVPEEIYIEAARRIGIA